MLVAVNGCKSDVYDWKVILVVYLELNVEAKTHYPPILRYDGIKKNRRSFCGGNSPSVISTACTGVSRVMLILLMHSRIVCHSTFMLIHTSNTQIFYSFLCSCGVSVSCSSFFSFHESTISYGVCMMSGLKTDGTLLFVSNSRGFGIST